MLGAGATTTAAEADLVVSAAAVAETVTLRLAETGDGAVYVAALVVVLVSAPQAVPVPPAQATLHVTPLPLESLSTVAAYFTVCPWSIFVCVEGER